jgi:hypothetical protein
MNTSQVPARSNRKLVQRWKWLNNSSITVVISSKSLGLMTIMESDSGQSLERWSHRRSEFIAGDLLNSPNVTEREAHSLGVPIATDLHCVHTLHSNNGAFVKTERLCLSVGRQLRNTWPKISGGRCCTGLREAVRTISALRCPLISGGIFLKKAGSPQQGERGASQPSTLRGERGTLR